MPHKSKITNEEIFRRGRKYSSRTEFTQKDLWASKLAKERGIYDEVCAHMDEIIHPNDYWTEARCYEVARLCTSPTDFQEKYGSARAAAKRQGFYGEMKKRMKAEGIWKNGKNTERTKESCWAIAKKFEYKKDFIEQAPLEYGYAARHGFVDEICSHMKMLGSIVRRKIYVFEFEDGYAYVGLSYNPEIRRKRHLRERDSAVFKHIAETGNSKYSFKVLTDLLDKDDASKREEEIEQEYATKGWKMLNRMKCGGLGSKGNIKYSKEQITKTAKGYSKRSEFNKHEKGMYLYAYRKGWLDEVCAHMPKRAKPRKRPYKPRVWTEDKIQEIISLGLSRRELYQKYHFVFRLLKEQGRLDKYFPKT